MYHGSQEGWVEVVSGVMFSGKSEEFMRRLRRAVIAKKRVQVFKSHLDDRYAGVHRISSHDGSEIEAHPINTSGQIAEMVREDTQVVGIDEAQFLDDGVVKIVSELADNGIRVVIAGTDMDFRGEPFGPIPKLLAIAEIVDKLHAICVKCGDLATRNQRLIDGEPAPAEGPTILVGASESYEARCRACHEVPTVSRHQTALDIDDHAAAWVGRTKYW